MTAGYSGTPLARKLGIKEGSRILLIGETDDYASLLQPLPESVSFTKRASKTIDLVHLFVVRREDMQKHLVSLHKKLKPDACIWVSWPKKSSRVPTNITEDTIREIALPLGFVDIKVCAVSEVWSALKIVVRKELR